MSYERKAAVSQGLEDFDRTSLREGAAALALWPRNADRHAALEELVDALAPEPEARGAREIGVDEWAAWLAGEDGKALQEVLPDGLHDAPLAEEATLLGARRALLAGKLEFPALHYGLWIEAMAAGADPHLRAGSELLTAAAWLCNSIVEFAGIGSYKWPAHEGPGPVKVPPAEEFERLRAALRIEFDDSEVATILEPLQRGPEASPWQPLSRESVSTLLVADPWQLSLAALVRSVDLAARSPQMETVLAAIQRSALAVAGAAVREMGWTIEDVGEDHLVVRADVDCLVVVGVGVISPDPAELAAESVSGDPCLVERNERIASFAHSLGASHSLLAVIGDGRAVTCDDPSIRASVESDPWIVGLGELRAIGEALRGDPLALPAALRSIARPPWPENLDLLDWVGMVRQSEEAASKTRDLPLDGTEFMLLLGRKMASRHPAPAPDLAGWIEVTRWEGIEDPAIYCGRERDEFALLVRSFGRYAWVTCPGALERRYDLLPVVATTLAFWLARLFEAGFMEGQAAVVAGDPIYSRFRLELDPRPGPHLATAPRGAATRVILGPGFVEAMCNGDNDSDRMLVAAVLSWVEGGVGSLLDEVVPEGRGTVAIWPSPEVTTNAPRLDPPPPVEPRFRQEIERRLAASRVEAGKIFVASDEQLAPVLENLARGLETGIQDSLDSLEPAALRALVALHERSIRQSLVEAINLPARSVMRFAESYPDFKEGFSHRDLTLRVLIERCSALPPHGTEPFGRRIGAELRAATELQLELRSTLDAVRWEKAGGRVVISPELGIDIELGGELPDASQAMKAQVITAAPDLMAKAHSDWWGERPELGIPPALDEPVVLGGEWTEVDLAMAEEWGIALEQMVRILHALAAIADEQSDCVGLSAVDAIGPELARRTAIPAAVIARAVERLVLSVCPEYDTFEEEYQPGRANRERSYLRCPLVALPGGELCWSSLHCERAADYLGSLIQSGRLRAEGPLGIAVTGFSQRLDRDFEDAVLAAVHGCGWQGEARLQRLDGVPLRRRRGEEIGDLDVLAWSPGRREVWLLDAKRLNPGVEPGPMLREGLTFEKHIERHEERLRWVRDHLPELAREIGSEAVAGWEIRAALVLDKPLAGAHLSQTSMPIWTLWALPRELSGETEAAGA